MLRTTRPRVVLAALARAHHGAGVSRLAATDSASCSRHRPRAIARRSGWASVASAAAAVAPPLPPPPVRAHNICWHALPCG